MSWFGKHRKALILLIILAVLAGVTIASAVAASRDGAVSETSGTLIGTITKPFSYAGSKLSSGIKTLFGSSDLKTENEKLQKENEKLRRQVQKNALSRGELDELSSLKKALKYSDKGKTGDYVSGKITSMDGTSYVNVFTIDIGSSSGVKEGDLVVCGKGLVGRVKSVGKGWSKVITLLDSNMDISFQVNGNPSILGVLDDSNGKTLSGYTLDSSAVVSEGDTLVTSGLGTIPAGIPIGKVTRARRDSNAELLKVTVRPSADFNALREVMVLL